MLPSTLSHNERILLSAPTEISTSAQGDDVDSGVKLAVSVIGPFTVTLAGLLEPLKDPEPLPVQLLKPNPALGAAEMPTPVPLLYQPLGGLTVPPDPVFIVRKY